MYCIGGARAGPRAGFSNLGIAAKAGCASGAFLLHRAAAVFRRRNDQQQRHGSGGGSGSWHGATAGHGRQQLGMSAVEVATALRLTVPAATALAPPHLLRKLTGHHARPNCGGFG